MQQLKAFMANTQSARGVFIQVVIAKSGKKPQKSEGFFAWQRPGKFRWSYEVPYRQLLVSDGEKLWSYDTDLKQVTISKLGTALGSSPAALLAGRELEKHFDLKEDPSNAMANATSVDSVEFVEAKPKGTDTSFASMKIGFSGNQPVRMEIHDHFGQVTLLSFTQYKANPSLPPDYFKFTPPKGADVVGE